MIATKEIKIKVVENLTSDYIESELKNNGLDVLRWAIVAVEKDFYVLNIAYFEN